MSIFLILNHKPCSGVRIKGFGLKTKGLLDLEQGKNSKLFRIDANPTLVCISPNRSPIQFLGPSPNGRNDMGCLFLASSGANLSGL